MKRFKIRRARPRFSFKKRAHHSNSSGVTPGKAIIAGAAYGIVRAPIARLADPLLSKLNFFGANLGDEIGMGLASYFAAKKGSGFVKQMGYAGLYCESAKASEYLVNNGLNLLSGGSSATSNNTGLFVA